MKAAELRASHVGWSVVGQGRAAELLYNGRALDGEEAEGWGFYNRLCDPPLPEGRRRCL